MKLDAAKEAVLRRSFSQGTSYKRLAPHLNMSRATLCRRLSELALVRHLGMVPPEGKPSCEVALRLMREARTDRKAVARRILDCLELCHLAEQQGEVTPADWGRIKGLEGDAIRQSLGRLGDWLKAEARIRLRSKIVKQHDHEGRVVERRLVVFSLRRMRLLVGPVGGRVDEEALRVIGVGPEPEGGRGAQKS